MVPLPWYDLLEIDCATGAPGVDLIIDPASEIAPDGQENLAWRAAMAFLAETGARLSVSIRLTKSIPAGSGLGGGSSDAAGVLLALNAALDSPLCREPLRSLAASLGSDCPFFLDPRPSVISGRHGEVFTPVEGFPALDVVVAVPVERLSTRDVFRFDLTRPPESANDPCLLARGGWAGTEWTALIENDLAPTVMAMCPRSRDLGEALERSGAVAWSVTGTGSAVFGVFGDGRSAAKAAAVVGTRLRPGEKAVAFRTGR